MSDITRRDALRRLGVALVATGMVDRAAAQEVHHFAAQATGAAGAAYTPNALTAHEYQTLQRLTDLIIPVENGNPGALAAGAAAWIDMISSENDKLKEIYRSGFAWLDAAMMKRGAADFVSATPAQQIEMLDLIAYRRNQSAELDPGIQFFTWVRRMTVDAFYTSEIGIRDIDYRGNAPVAVYTVPPESIEYALKRSGL
jgi:gluconate 2-dehydrogenase gamma chain